MARTSLRLFLSVGLSFLSVLALGGSLIHLSDRNQVLQNQKAAMDVAAMHGHLLQEQVNRSLSATYALAAVLRQGKGQIDNFEALAAEMLHLYAGTSVIQLAPKGVITRIVPMAGNEGALGHDLLQDPRRNKEAFTAVETKQLTLAGPFALRQGGIAVVGRLPVFLPDGNGNEQFWGFATALIRISDLLTASKLDSSPVTGYDYELSRIHPDTGQRDVFANSSAKPLQEPLSYRVAVPNGIWTLDIARRGGWHTAPEILVIETGVAVLVAALAALLTFYMVQRPLSLHREVESRTRDLSRANRELETEMQRRSQAEGNLRERVSEIEVVLGALSDGVIALDGEGRVRYANRAARALLGDSWLPVEGRHLDQLLAVIDEDSGQEIQGLSRAVIQEGRPLHLRGNARVRTRAGREFDAQVSAVPAPESGEVAMIFVFTDISAEISKERQIEFQAFHDPLTELGNRTLLARDLALDIERAANLDKRVGLLCLDLDNFKNINDALGHAVGDTLLKQLASRLRSVLGGRGWITRHGGDEFIVVIPLLETAEQATDIAEALMYSIAQPFRIEEKELRVTSSIGICICPDHGSSIGELVSNADLAMFEAKRSGRNTYRFYEVSQLQRSAERLAMENGLRIALAERELSLAFQPKVRIANGHMNSVEALLRWNSKRHGPIPPATFIPIAEDMGLITEIGDWVLREALAASRRLRARLGYDLVVAVNVSPIQFRSKRLIDTLRELAAEEPDLPRLLELELTEQALAGDMAEVTANLQSIKELGLRIAIDDFGTGYSSLAYLKHFPIDILKIDRAFIRDLPVNPQDKAIVGSVVSLGKSLGFDVVAEGVEEAAHLDALAQLGCDYAQGYWFSRPIPESELVAKLRAAESSLPA